MSAEADPAAAFRGRVAAIGTMHGKERAVGPVLADGLGVSLVIPAGLDTDRYGTFTRDVPRHGSQLDAARHKAEAAMDLTGSDLGVASEGSFGPHPAVPWVQANLELVLLVDRRHSLEIVGRHVALQTVAAGGWVGSEEQALDFAAGAGFPDHAIVVRRTPGDRRDITKGITAATKLRAAVAALLTDAARVWLESDLRAHHNPTRMAVIAAAAADLVANARRLCPACGTPGLSPRTPVFGLPCRWCGGETGLVLEQVYGCDRCGDQAKRPRDDGRTHADPSECPVCNP